MHGALPRDTGWASWELMVTLDGCLLQLAWSGIQTRRWCRPSSDNWWKPHACRFCFSWGFSATSVTAGSATQQVTCSLGSFWNTLMITSWCGWLRNQGKEALCSTTFLQRKKNCWGCEGQGQLWLQWPWMVEFRILEEWKKTPSSPKLRNGSYQSAGNQAKVAGSAHGWTGSSWLNSDIKRKHTRRRRRTQVTQEEYGDTEHTAVDLGNPPGVHFGKGRCNWQQERLLKG